MNYLAFRYLRSKKLALVLLILLTGASIYGMLVDTNAFQSTWFITLGLIFLINMAACTLHQLYVTLMQYRKNKKLKPYSHYLGLPLLHFGLLITLIGILVTLAFKMHGFIEISEGETRPEEHATYLQIEEGPLFAERHLGFNITLDKQNRIFKGDKLDYIRSDFTITDHNNTFQASLDKRQPFNYRGIKFFHKAFGFSPRITIKKSGQVLHDSYILFPTTEAKEGEYAFALDNFQLPGTDLTMTGEFYPDLSGDKNNYHTKTYLLRNPQLKLLLKEGDKLIYDGLIPIKGSISSGPYEISFSKTVLWTAIELNRDPGANLFFAGSLISLLGLIILYYPGLKKLFTTDI